MSISAKTLAFVNPKEDIRTFEQVEEMLADSSCVSLCLKSSFDFIKNKLDEIFKNNISGDIVLAGVWRGGLAAYIQAILLENNQTHRKLYLSDTFNGFLPVSDDHPSDKKMANYFMKLQAPTGNVSEIKKMFDELELPVENVVFLEGDLTKTTKNLKTKISFLIIDVDFYEPTYNALNNLYPLVEENGCIYIDDYNVNEYECKKAVDNFIKDNSLKTTPKIINKFAVFWQKNS